MLIQRVITALILLPLVLGIIWFAPTPWLYTLFAAAGLAVVWEWSALMGLTQRSQRLLYVALSGVLLAATWALRAYWPWIAGIAALWWCFALYLLFGFPENLRKHKPGLLQMAVLGQVLLLPTILTLAVLHEMRDGRLWLLYAFVLVWAADIGAYFVGRSLGRHKLAPNISPGKTVEGAIGGLALCALWALIAGTYIFQVSGTAVWTLVALSLIVSVLSMVGDLTESMFKRLAGVKDSGHILPGHGGILDRVDSLLAAAPILALGLYLAGL